MCHSRRRLDSSGGSCAISHENDVRESNCRMCGKVTLGPTTNPHDQIPGGLGGYCQRNEHGGIPNPRQNQG